jgi:hypothetical protein
MLDTFQNAEFERNLPLFRYFKIIGMKVIIPPRLNTDNVQLPNARISMDWADGTGENIQQDDSSKEITAYSTRTKVYKFKPPNLLIKSAAGNQFLNYSEWMPTNQTAGYVPPGYFKITTAFTFNMTIEVLVMFRGSQFGTNSNKIRKIEKIEEEKEEEKEEEEEKREEIREERDEEKGNDEKIKELEEELRKLKIEKKPLNA